MSQVRRRQFLIAAGGFLAAPVASLAQQQPAKIPRIGYLVEAPLTDPPSRERAAFLEGLRELGYLEGKNLIIEYRSAESEPDFLPDLAADLLKSGVQLIFAAPSRPVIAAMKVSATIPIVFVIGVDPVQQGFTRSLARPDKNVTGITTLAYDLGPKRLELLSEVVPHAKRVAVLRISGGSGAEQMWESIRRAGPKLGLDCEPYEVRDAVGLARQLERIARSKPDALLVMEDNRTIAARKIIADFAISQRLPSAMGYTGYADAGGLMSLAPNIPEEFRRAAMYVDKILKGAKPGELAIEQPLRLELIINLKTAKAIGITLPATIQFRADRVIN